MWTDRLKSRKTILIVENDSTIRGLLCRALRRTYRVIAADTAEEAVVIAAQHQNHIDLLLTAARLPRMCGWELMQVLALDYPKLNVIYVTKSIDPEIRVHTRRQKLILLEQPFPKALVEQSVRDVLESAPSTRGIRGRSPSVLLRLRSYLRRHLSLHPTT